MRSTRSFRRLIGPAVAIGAGLALASTASAGVWFPMGTGITGAGVNAITSDSAGNVYAGGSFSAVGGVSVNNVARWDGVTWHAMSGGLNGTVNALAVDSHGHLFAGGSFTASGSTAVSNIARWTGAEWEPVNTGLNGTVTALAADTAGNLYAGGAFSGSGVIAATNVAKWNGTVWSSLGVGANNTVNTLLVGTGNVLYAGGAFTSAGGVSANNVASWNGTAWAAMPGIAASVNPPGPTPTAASQVYGLGLDASGSVNAAGLFATTAAPAQSQGVAKWTGTTWVGLGTGTGLAATKAVVAQPGGLMAGGGFAYAGTAVALGVATWNGSQWAAVGGGINDPVQALYNDASGNTYAGGSFTVADGTQVNGIAVKPVVPPATQPATAPCAATFYQQAGRTQTTATTRQGRAAIKVVSRIRIFQEAQPWCQTDLTFIYQNVQTGSRLSQLPGSTLGYRTLQGQDFSAPVVSWPPANEMRFTSGDPTGQNRVNARLVLVSYLQRQSNMPLPTGIELNIVRRIPVNPGAAASGTNPLYAQTNAMGTTVGWAQVN